MMGPDVRIYKCKRCGRTCETNIPIENPRCKCGGKMITATLADKRQVITK